MGATVDGSGPMLERSMALSRRLASAETPLADVADAIRALAAEAFEARAERLGRYLGETDPARNAAALDALFDRLAEDAGDFEPYRAAVERPRFGIVLTGHPTFALSRDLSLALVELATGRDATGAPLDAEGIEARRALARERPHNPPDPLTLDVEHDWSAAALENALDAVEAATRAALAAARRRWPERWTELTPRLMTLATWVGFDQDGRTDVTWQISLGKRLDLKRRMLRRLEARLAAGGAAAGPAVALLRRAAETVERQAGGLSAALGAQEDADALPALGRALAEGRDAALTTAEPLIAALDAAFVEVETEPAREALLLARAGLATQGLSLAHIHVRLNAAQLHAAVRADVGLATDPGDPANRRTYFHAIERLIETVRPETINLGSLQAETSSARRLMMTVAEMAKSVDAAPVRFLIAESESGFTLLSALYLARLFGVEDKVEISPLFETAEGFEAGEHLIEEALRSPCFREHLQAHGRLAIEFGFSDSGRFIGQMAATFRIERLRLRLGDMLERLGLTGLEVVFFNTHGESIGRGGHPGSLGDRFRYAAPPASRAEFAAREIALKEEDSFQGGEGYLPLFTPAAALATVRTALETVLVADPEGEGDPIYAAQDFASEFFATVQQAFAGLVADCNYAALLGLYGTRLLRKTGSRPEQRQSGDAATRELSGVHDLRAIPNNGILQQLGRLANTLHGVGRAAAKDPATFADMLARSPRFGRALAMVSVAAECSDVDVLRAYAALVDPDTWMRQAAGAGGPERLVDLRLSERAESAGLTPALGEVMRRLEADALALADALPTPETARRARLRRAHGLRLALMALIDRLGAEIPRAPGVSGFEPDTVLAALMRMDLRFAQGKLDAAFPDHAAAHPDADRPALDWGEPASYRPEPAQHGERDRLVQPIAEAYALCLQLTSAITHDLGACG